MTLEERKSGFELELKKLLAKYNAELALEDFGECYATNEKIVVDFAWTEEGDYGQLILGRFIDGTSELK